MAAALFFEKGLGCVFTPTWMVVLVAPPGGRSRKGVLPRQAAGGDNLVVPVLLSPLVCVSRDQQNSHGVWVGNEV